jgi:hypothetical protein
VPRAFRVGLGACALWLSVSAASARAARIEVLTSENPDMALVVVEGEFGPDDGKRFTEVTAPHPHAMVFVNSPGGGAIAGMQVGQVIRSRR